MNRGEMNLADCSESMAGLGWVNHNRFPVMGSSLPYWFPVPRHRPKDGWMWAQNILNAYDHRSQFRNRKPLQ